MTIRYAGEQEPLLPLMLAAAGLMPGLPSEGVKAAYRRLGRAEPALLDMLDVLEPPGSDPRDYRIEPGLWRSEILPKGVSIGEAIQMGVWG